MSLNHFLILFLSIAALYSLEVDLEVGLVDLPKPALMVDWDIVENKPFTHDFPYAINGGDEIRAVKSHVNDREDAISITGATTIKLSGAGLGLGPRYTIDVWILFPHVPLSSSYDALVASAQGESPLCIKDTSIGVYTSGKFKASPITLSTLNDGYHRITMTYNAGVTNWYLDRSPMGNMTEGSNYGIRYIGNTQAGTGPFGVFNRLRVYQSELSAEDIKNKFPLRDNEELAALQAIENKKLSELGKNLADIKKAVELTLKARDETVKISEQTVNNNDKLTNHSNIIAAAAKETANNMELQVPIKSEIDFNARLIDRAHTEAKNTLNTVQELHTQSEAGNRQLEQAIQRAIQIRKELNSREDLLLKNELSREKISSNRQFELFGRNQRRAHDKELSDNKMIMEDEKEERMAELQRLNEYLSSRKDRMERLAERRRERIKQADDLAKSLSESTLYLEKVRSDAVVQEMKERREQLAREDEIRRRQLLQMDEDRRRHLEETQLEREKQIEREEELRKERMTRQDEDYKRMVERTKEWIEREHHLMAQERLENEEDLNEHYEDSQMVAEQNKEWRNKMTDRLLHLQKKMHALQNAERALAWRGEDVAADINVRRYNEAMISVAKCVRSKALGCCLGIKKPHPSCKPECCKGNHSHSVK